MDGCARDIRHRRLQETGQSVEEVGDVHGKREHLEALCFGAFSSAGCMDAEAHNLKDPVRTQWFRDVGQKGSHLLAESLCPCPETFGEVIENVDLVLDGCDEAHVVASFDLALFEQRKDVALNPGPDVVWLELCDQDGAAVVDVAEPVLEDRGDELFLRTEVVLNGRVVAAPRRSADLAERDALVAAVGKELLGRENDLFLGRPGNRRRRRHLTITRYETTLYRASQAS